MYMDVVASFCVGWSETLVGYPFVTAKVLVQNGESWRQPFLHYYRGVKYPLMSSVGFNMIVFPVHERLFRGGERCCGLENTGNEDSFVINEAQLCVNSCTAKSTNIIFQYFH